MAKTNYLLSLILVLALLAQIASPACASAKKEVLLGAVVGEEEGGVFLLGVELRPGNGSVYSSVSPLTGISTQESMQQAADYAFRSTGIDQAGCDVLFTIKGDFGENRVDGPSAGAAMAMATRAALLNRPIRPDIVVTGTISQDGKIGEVGGVIEKSLAASKSGASHILVPSIKLYESLLLSQLSAGKDFAAIEVESVPEAEAMLFSPPGHKFNATFSPKSKPVPSGMPESKYDADTGRFALVANRVVDELEGTVENILPYAPEGAEKQELGNYFSSEISKYRKQISLGYPFTAANAAFLLSIDAQYVRLWDANLDVDNGFSEVEGCIASLSEPKKTRENFHWAVGSDLRRLWAQKKLNETAELRLEQSAYMTMRDLFFAYSWCKISGELAGQAGEIGGPVIDESSLESLASEKLSEADEMLYSSPAMNYDAAWHLKNGMGANQSGLYGAAIYEAAYAMAMQGATNDASSGNVSAAAEKSLASKRESLWGKIYYGQGKYIFYDANLTGFSPSDSYSVLRYSSELDRVSAEIDTALASGAPSQQAAAIIAPILAGSPQKHDLPVAIVLLFSIFILFAEAIARAFFSRGEGR
jgi:hypothetical protein